MHIISRGTVFLPPVFQLLERCSLLSEGKASAYLAGEERAIRLCFAHTVEQVDLVQMVSVRRVVSKYIHRRLS
jgi:hypothetical protein